MIDFDGPLCHLFAGFPAPEVAENLRAKAEPFGEFSGHLSGVDDPLEVIRIFAAGCGDAESIVQMDLALERLETQAASTATKAEGADLLVAGLAKRGLQWGVATNNSEPAVRRFFKDAGWDLPPLACRVIGSPHLMKPNPASLERLLSKLDAEPKGGVFLGDSPSDMAAAIACGVRPIGHANKPGKREALLQAGAESVVDFPQDLLRLLNGQ